MKCLIKLSELQGDKYGTDDLFTGLLVAAGASAGSMPDNPKGDKSWSSDWEWFDPQLMTEEDYADLPEHWQAIVRNQNQECWNLEYKYIHAPYSILSQYPRVRVKGIFSVTNSVSPENVKGNDLIHLGGQFTEWDCKDKCIWRSNIASLQED